MITVCYNAEDTIEKTIESVINQSYENIEYLIIDGGSPDKTWNIIQRYIDIPNIKMLSEPDKGLYNAMNKGTSMATGEYIIFMNSGDVFYDNDVIRNAVPFLTAQLVYGNVIRLTSKGRILERYYGRHHVMRLLLQGRMMCHQSIFTRTDIMKQYQFDEKYTITADYDFIMRLKHDKCSMCYLNQTVSIVDNIEGISSSLANMETMRREDDQSLKENFPVYYYMIYPMKMIVRCFKRNLIEKCH